MERIEKPVEAVLNETILLKESICVLCNETSSNLPKEHRSEIRKFLALIKSLDVTLEQATEEAKPKTLQYYGSTLLYEANSLLNKLHDIIEVRMIQGVCYDGLESTFLTDLTNLYNKLLNDIIPDLPSGSGVISVPSKDAFSRLRAIMSENTPGLNNLNIFSLSFEELDVIKGYAGFESNIIKYGPILVSSKGALKLNYLFLLKSHLIFANKELRVKKKYNLTQIPKATIRNNMLEIMDIRVCSSEIKLWCEAINSTIDSKNKTEVENNRREDDRTFDILVTVKKMENLRPSPKSRPDNPFFFIGVGNPEHFCQDRVERFKSAGKKTRNPEFNETFTLKLSPLKELIVDIRVYSKVSAGRNDFSYGVINIPLNDLVNSNEEERKEEINAWFDIISKGGKEGRAHICIELVKSSIPNWIFNCKSIQALPLAMHDQFTILEKAPFIYAGSNLEIVASVKTLPTGFSIVDSVSGATIYSIEKSSMIRKEYTIKNDKKQPFARCFHKMKTIRKKKIRMMLGTNEPLYSMEGGCFDNKSTDNEVMVFNICGKPVASIVFGDKTSESLGSAILVDILDPLIDKALLVAFTLYVIKTLL